MPLQHTWDQRAYSEAVLECVFDVMGVQSPLLHFLYCVICVDDLAEDGVCFGLGHRIVNYSLGSF